MYEGHIDKAKGAGIEGRRWGWVGHGEVVEGWMDGDNYT